MGSQRVAYPDSGIAGALALFHEIGNRTERELRDPAASLSNHWVAESDAAVSASSRVGWERASGDGSAHTT